MLTGLRTGLDNGPCDHDSESADSIDSGVSYILEKDSDT